MDIGPIVRALRRNKVRAGLIVAEIALTLAIVTNCVAMIVEARGKMQRASGFDDERIRRGDLGTAGDQLIAAGIELDRSAVAAHGMLTAGNEPPAVFVELAENELDVGGRGHRDETGSVLEVGAVVELAEEQPEMDLVELVSLAS